MKFQNAETGETFHTIEEALESYCKHMVSCDTCPLYQTNTGTSLTCNEFVNRYPGEFARLILYSPIPQDYLNTDQCPCDKCYMGPRKLPICHTCLVYQAWERRKEQMKSEAAEKYLKIKGADTEDRRDKPCDSCQRGKGTGLSYFFECGNCGENGVFDRFKPNEEGNMDKPRICEVLGVEVGERFELGNTGIILLVNDDGLLHIGLSHGNHKETDMNVNYLVKAINDPDRIIRKPRFTEQEVERAKAIKVIFPEAKEVRTRNDVQGEVEYRVCTGCAVLGVLYDDVFPTMERLKEYTLDEIIGGGE